MKFDITQEANISLISKEIINNIPVRSIFLCGSRVKKDNLANSSDYDVGIIMNTFLIPFYLRKLKNLENKLRQRLRTRVTINPLPVFKVNRAKGNLFLFKLENQGLTVYGRDYLKTINAGSIRDININSYISYLFFAVKELVHRFNPEYITNKLDEEQYRMFIRDATKAILCCREIYLSINNGYGIESKTMIKDPQIVTENEEDSLDFWFRAKECLLGTFCLLMQKYLRSNEDNIEKLISKYIKVINKNWLKNLQYFFLALLLKKEIFWKSLLTRYSIEDKIRVALLWLLLSLDKKGYINKGLLVASFNLLKNYTKMTYFDNDIILWKHTRDSIMTYYPFASTLMGI